MLKKISGCGQRHLKIEDFMFLYRAPNRTKILLYIYYILVVFIVILACKILYTY